jgi:RHS repeat-associated protein
VDSGTFVRKLAVEADQATGAITSNRLATTTIGQDVFMYAYDANGNVVTEAGTRRMEWDHADRLRAFRTQAGVGPASVESNYLYDAGGTRVLKLVRRQSGYDVSVYIDGVFERHRRAVGTVGAGENTRIHIVDGERTIALWRSGDSDDQRPDVQYQLGDHLGSANVVVGGTNETGATFVDREEFYPFGETSFGSFAKKRYRFTGKEQDEESGLYYHGARYYAPWLGRWLTCDPAGLAGGTNGYIYASQTPIGRIDPDGRMDLGMIPGSGGGLVEGVEITKDVATGIQTYAYSAPSTGAAVATGTETAVVAGPAAAPAATGGGITLGAVALTVGVAILVLSAFALFAYCYVGNDKYQRMAREMNEKRRAEARQKEPHIAPGANDGQPRSAPSVNEDAAVIGDPASNESRSAPGHDVGRNFVFPGMKVYGEMRLSGKKGSGTKARRHNRTFMAEMLRRILNTPGHPLHVLVDPKLGNWQSRRQDAETTSVQAGHLDSLHSGLAERLALEDSTFNQVASNVGETQGAIFNKTAVSILGIPVEYRTARLLEGAGLLAPGTVMNAPSHPGWTP